MFSLQGHALDTGQTVLKTQCKALAHDRLCKVCRLRLAWQPTAAMLDAPQCTNHIQKNGTSMVYAVSGTKHVFFDLKCRGRAGRWGLHQDLGVSFEWCLLHEPLGKAAAAGVLPQYRRCMTQRSMQHFIW